MMTALLGRFRGLQLRFMLVVVAGAIVFAVMVGRIAYGFGFDATLLKDRATIEDLMASVEKTAAIGAYAGDTVLLQEVIDGIALNPLVGHVEVRAPSGSVLVNHAIVDRNGSGRSYHLHRDLASPFLKSEVVGSLNVILDTAKLEADARRDAARLAMPMVVEIAMLALILYVVSAWLVSNPIVRLARVLRNVTPGTNARLTTPRLHDKDEIGTLIFSVNALLSETEAALSRERALRSEVEAMEAQYRQIFNSSSAGIFVLDAQGRLINGNPTVLRLIGSELQETQQLRGEDFLRLVFARPDRVQTMVAEADLRGETVSADLELIDRKGVGCWVHCLISVQGNDTPSAESGRIVEGVMYDVTERKRTEIAVRQLAEHDALTGLKNRAACDRTIELLIANAARDGGAFTLMCIDLDGFKKVNDELGHGAGDQVLAECAQRMKSAMRRKSDLVCRVGGDEFLILMPDMSPDDIAAAAAASDIVRRLAEPFDLSDNRIARIGASIGMASFPRHGSTRAELAEAADEALYQVKRHGKNAASMSIARASRVGSQNTSRPPVDMLEAH